MAILAMGVTAVPAVRYAEQTDMGETPMLLTGETPVLLMGKMPMLLFEAGLV